MQSNHQKPSTRTLPDYAADKPLVSIVILNLDKPDLTINCLEHIWRNTEGVPYEVIVVDNGSSAENQRKLGAYDGPHIYLPLMINRFFGEGNNIGAEKAKGEFLLFLNNDVMVTKGWLKPLIDVFYEHDDVGCSGPKFVYPSGDLQEAGALLDEDGTSVQIGKFQPPEQARFNRQRVVDYVSAATVLMRRQDFMDVLGFDFRYEPAYYEDCDLCLKIGSMGKKTYYVPSSKVVHYENATTADQSNKLKLQTIVPLNQAKFVERWRAYLKTGRHSGAPVVGPLVAPAASTAKKTAGIFTPYNIIPGGGERYLLNVMQVIASQGYALTLIVPELFSRIRISTVLQKLDLELDGLDIITYAEAEKMEAFDLFYCLGNEVCPTSKPLGKTNIYCCQFPFKSDPAELKRRLPWLEHYSSIICYSEFVEQAIKRSLKKNYTENADVQVVSPPVGLTISVDPNKEKEGILGIGRFFSGGHCKRQDIMVEAVRELSNLEVDVSLNLVGSLHPEPEHRAYFLDCKTAAQGLPVQFHIDAPPSTLGDLLSKASFYWHGAGFEVDVEESPELCEHFGISVIEAMAARVIPFVVSNGGPASIVENGVSGFHYSSLQELVELTQEVQSYDPEKLAQIRNNAQERAAHYSQDAFREQLLRVINKALQNSA